MGPLILAVDLGTSGVKAALMRLDGEIVASARRHYSPRSPRPGWCEQDAEEWWGAVVESLRELSSSIRGPLEALCVAGQAPGHVLVDRELRPLRPAILWADRRAEREASRLREVFAPAELAAFTGAGFPVDAANPLARLLWLARHEPERVARAASVLQPKDFVNARLTGNVATDRFSAFSVAHVRKGCYHEELLARLEAMGIPRSLLPPVIEPHQCVGVLGRSAARETGLPEGTPVLAGTIDAWCSIIGALGHRAGCAVDVSGTSEVVALVVEDRDPASQSAMPLGNGLAFHGGPNQAGTSLLHWAARLLGLEGGLPALETLAREVRPGCDGLVLLPYIRGERAPVWDPRARGVLFGLAQEHGPAHLARAAYEAVAFSVRHILEDAERAAGAEAQVVRVAGGGARSAFWNQMKADVLQRRVEVVRPPESALTGAAMLAALGAGLVGSLEEAAAMVRVADTFTPRPDLKDIYDSRYGLYRSLYPSLQVLFARDEVDGPSDGG